MAFRIEDIVRSIQERARLYISILLVAIAVFVLLEILAFALTAILGMEAPVVPALLILALLGILIGVLTTRFVPTLKYELKSESPVVVIIAGAIIFAALNALFALYAATVGPYSIFSSMPLVQVTFADLISKLVVAFIDGFIKGLVLFAAAILGASI